jgi:hypothetical protein
MAVVIGDTLGVHEITSLLGKGGMGEVYRARDTRLKRDVAIKILPAEFARDPDRLLRFRREAEVLAALNHPNIGAIYDFQEAGHTQFLVMELVEGENLADRLRRGLPAICGPELARGAAAERAAGAENGPSCFVLCASSVLGPRSLVRLTTDQERRTKNDGPGRRTKDQGRRTDQEPSTKDQGLDLSRPTDVLTHLLLEQVERQAAVAQHDVVEVADVEL